MKRKQQQKKDGRIHPAESARAAKVLISSVLKLILETSAGVLGWAHKHFIKYLGKSKQSSVSTHGLNYIADPCPHLHSTVEQVVSVSVLCTSEGFFNVTIC